MLKSSWFQHFFYNVLIKITYSITSIIKYFCTSSIFMALQFLKKQPTNVLICIFLLIWGAMFMVLAAVQPMLAPLLTGDPNMDTKTFFAEGIALYPTAYMLLNLVSTCCMFFMPVLLYTFVAADKPLAYLGLNQKTSLKQFLLVTIGVLGIFPLISGLGALIQELNLGAAADAMEEKRTNAINTYITQGSVLDLLRNLFLVALVPAVFEELFFRGIIQRLAYTFTKSPLISFVLTAFLFTLFHASIYQFLPIFVGGIMLCWLYHITGNMKLNIWLHFLNNGIQIVLLYLTGATEAGSTANNLPTILAYLTTGIIVSVVVYTQLKKNATPLPKDWHFNPNETLKQPQ